ncbi:hypothetical protein AFL01nite_20790 [Aeromicrobium flavum]|uniref:CN hydrolase domain-containing protein n=1 Tax=Aeromicrobium flavum TaxID=416568 RepID=A0A512HWC6_9ACTN|nr:hypothetical protein AFL01nite_20790 [Aeromicrobium flavum]
MAFVVAAVQAAYVLLDRDATVARVETLTAEAAGQGAALVVFPEAFIPGTPLWIDSVPVWDGDGPWYARLVDQSVVVPGPTTERLGRAARSHGVHLVIGVQEREPHGTTVYNTVLYFGPDGRLLSKHRKLVPTGSERTVWGQGDGSTLEAVPTALGRLGGLICWETTCRSHASISMPRGSRCGSRRRWLAATGGSPRCGTSPARAGCGWSA